MSIRIPGFTLGIVGGGQLGRMMAVEARRLGIKTIVLDPSSNPPAAGIADETLQGSLYDPLSLGALARRCDVVTYEIEHINITALYELEAAGVHLEPRPRVLEIIQDKYRQKSFLLQSGLPVPGFAGVAAADVAAYVPAQYPVVQKLRTGGYDGRGVQVLLNAKSTRLQGESMFESCIDIDLELAVIVARGINHEAASQAKTAVYPVVEMVFDPRAQICSSVAAPARISDSQAKRAIEISVAAIEALDGYGIFAVELFLAKDGALLINEIAPRPHNSGHWTIESAVTNQFEQHVRAVCGLPLGSTELLRPSVMVNLLGAPGSNGVPNLKGLSAALALTGLKMHWYQKTSVQPLRKMGHFTVGSHSLEEALRIANQASDLLVVTGNEDVS